MPRSGSRVRVSFPAPVFQNLGDPGFCCFRGSATPRSCMTAVSCKVSCKQGQVAEWLCSGLQSRVRRFNSDPGLHNNPQAYRIRPPPCPGGEIGRRSGLKIRRLATVVPVQIRPRAPQALPGTSADVRQTQQNPSNYLGFTSGNVRACPLAAAIWRE